MRKISVVIPTLGGEQIFQTVASLMGGTVIPSEVLLILPPYSAVELSSMHTMYRNIKVIKSNKKGQVAQRLYGFLKAENDYVMQLDDDIILKSNCIEELLNIISSNENAAVAPVMLNFDGETSIYKNHILSSNLIIKIIDYILGNSADMRGKINKAGIPYGVYTKNHTDINRSNIQVDWLPGGCVLHHKKHLILIDYYPYSSKGYCEDLLHSQYLTNNKINLLISFKSKCYTTVINYYKLPFNEYFKSLFDDYRARKYFLRIRNDKLLFCYLFYIYRATKYLYLKCQK